MKRNPTPLCPLSYSYLLVILLTFCFSCASPNTEDAKTTLFADLYVRYLESERQLKAQASFMEGDSISNAKLVRLPKVTFQDKELRERDLPNIGVRYMLQQNGVEAQKDYIFKFQPKDCPEVEQTISLLPIGNFAIRDGIQKSKGMTLVMDEPTLTANESLVLLFSDQNNKAVSLEIKGPSNAKEIHFTPKQIQSLSLGKGQLYLVKKQISEEQKKDMEVQVAIEYYSRTIEVEVRD